MNTIKVRSASDIHFEYEAAETITPGQLLQITGNGKVQARANASQNVYTLIALEDELQCKEITDNYSQGDKVQCWYAQPGDVALLTVTTGQNIAIGDFVECAGNGLIGKHVPDTLSVGTIYSNSIIGVALEAAVTSTSTTRIKVLII